MAHSIIEFRGAHIMLKDSDLLEALRQLNAVLSNDASANLGFISDFLESDMIHVTGALDPGFETHLVHPEQVNAVLAAVEIASVTAAQGDQERVVNSLSKIKELLSARSLHS